MLKNLLFQNKSCTFAASKVKRKEKVMVQVFSPYQMQILDSIANVHSEKELCDIRDLIAEYFSNKALDEMDQLCKDGKLSTPQIQSWSKEHLRTAYL